MTRRRSRGVRSFMSGSLLQRAEYTCDGFRESQPAVQFGVGDNPALARQRVELGSAVVLRHAPFRLDESLLFHPVERRIERAFLDPQGVFRKLVNAERNAVSVVRPGAEALEHQQVERALNQIEVPDGHVVFPPFASLRRSKGATELPASTTAAEAQRFAGEPRPRRVHLRWRA